MFGQLLRVLAQMYQFGLRRLLMCLCQGLRLLFLCRRLLMLARPATVMAFDDFGRCVRRRLKTGTSNIGVHATVEPYCILRRHWERLAYRIPLVIHRPMLQSVICEEVVPACIYLTPGNQMGALSAWGAGKPSETSASLPRDAAEHLGGGLGHQAHLEEFRLK